MKARGRGRLGSCHLAGLLKLQSLVVGSRLVWGLVLVEAVGECRREDLALLLLRVPTRGEQIGCVSRVPGVVRELLLLEVRRLTGLDEKRLDGTLLKQGIRGLAEV